MGWANTADEPFSVTHAMKGACLTAFPDSLFLFSMGHADQSLLEHTPRVTTLRKLFTRYLDFNAVPRRSFFELLRWFATDVMERERLDEFVSKEGAVGYPWRTMTIDLPSHRTSYTSTVNR